MFDSAYFNLGYLDTLSYQDTAIHRLDPRAKIVATGAFIITVVSFSNYEVTRLLPFFLFPVLLFALGDIPVAFILRKVLIVSPFAIFIGIFNPLLDRHTQYVLFALPIPGGWLSFLSIMLKFFLTITSALLLIATTSFPGICHGLRKLGMPELFVSQLLFLYRYIFVLTEKAMKVVRAQDMRSFGRKGRGMKIFISIAGTLFLRTVERAERIYQAMLSRGFRGSIPALRLYSFRTADAVFLAITFSLLYLFRMHDIVETAGRFSAGIF